MRKIDIATGEIYHVFNRGVDKRKVFLKEPDYRRFYTDLFLYNNKDFFHPGGKNFDRDEMVKQQEKNLGRQQSFVRILSYCFLPNHFHLLLEQVAEDGVAKLMHRVTMGYARYFNIKYSRSGRLFEGTFKAVHVARNAQSEHLPRYIHLNALDLTSFEWREGKVSDWEHALRFLRQYLWSSHREYSGEKGDIPLVDMQFVRTQFPKPDHYISFLKEWSGRMLVETADGSQNKGDVS